MSAFRRAFRVLDEVQHLSQVERLDPALFAAAVRAELEPPGATLEALAGQLDGLRGLLGDVERFAEKCMRIRLHAATDGLPPPLRKLLQATVTSYERDLPLLRERIAPALARIDPRSAAATTDAVLRAAEQVLATRASLRDAVMGLAQELAAAWRPVVQRAARDRSQPDDRRERWKRAGVDLDQLAARAETLEGGSFDERLDRIPTPEDPPDEERPDRFSLLELD